MAVYTYLAEITSISARSVVMWDAGEWVEYGSDDGLKAEEYWAAREPEGLPRPGSRRSSVTEAAEFHLEPVPSERLACWQCGRARPAYSGLTAYPGGAYRPEVRSRSGTMGG